MEIKVSIELNLKDKEVTEAVTKAAQNAMRDTVVEVANDAIHHSPRDTGNNMRSIMYESSGSQGTGTEGIVATTKIGGAVYGTSGYSGYLETGTRRMAARPYFKPALDLHFSLEKFVNKMKGYLK
ncbi:MAG: hypothetical protein PHU08_00245 [Dehalococcoidales bacterium]|nr:hypothetical protein [Dehalococcoidales bacterium]